MIKPDFPTSRLNKICREILPFLDHWFTRFVVTPLLFVLPSTIVVSALANSNLLKQFEKAIGQGILGQLYSNHLMFVIAVVALTQIMRSIYSIVSHFAHEDTGLSKDNIVSVLTTIETVVQSKCNRFLRKTKIALKDKWSPSEIFTNITKPEQQIALIVQAVHGIFETLYGNKVEFRVGLMSVKNEQLTDWFVFAPENKPPKTDVTSLSTPSSAIMRALKSKSMIIVEDIQEELKKKNKDDRRFVKGSTQKNDQASILTAPIYCPNTRQPIYVISIIADRKDILQEKSRESYKWLLDLYFQRIIMEHHLYLMKEAIHEQNAA